MTIRFYKGTIGDISDELREISDSGVATNYGKFYHQLNNKLSKELAPYKTCLVASGTHALTLSLLALKKADMIPKSANILVPSFTFVASAQAILQAGMTPVFADINPKTWTINLDTECPSYDAVMPVNVFGVNPEVPKDIISVFDMSHGMGGARGGQKNGTTGTISAFSTSITKPFHTVEGGVVASANEDLVNSVFLMSKWSMDDDYDCLGSGQWSKLSEINAAVGLESIKMLQKSIEHKTKLAQAYRENLSGLPIQYQEIPEDCTTTYKDFCILVPAQSRNKILLALDEKDIGYKLYFYPPLHQTTYFKKFCPNLKLPVTEGISARVICLPIHEYISETDVIYITNVIRSCF